MEAMPKTATNSRGTTSGYQNRNTASAYEDRNQHPHVANVPSRRFPSSFYRSGSGTGNYENRIPHSYVANAPPRNPPPPFNQNGSTFPPPTQKVAPPGAAYSNGYPSYEFDGSHTYPRNFHSSYHPTSDLRNDFFSSPAQKGAPPAFESSIVNANYTAADPNQASHPTPVTHGVPDKDGIRGQPIVFSVAPPAPYRVKAHTQGCVGHANAGYQLGHFLPPSPLHPYHHNAYTHPYTTAPYPKQHHCMAAVRSPSPEMTINPGAITSVSVQHAKHMTGPLSSIKGKIFTAVCFSIFSCVHLRSQLKRNSTHIL